MQSITITLPDTAKQFVEDQVAAGSYASPSDYIHHLIRAEKKRQARELIEETILQSLNEGEEVEATPEWWESLQLGSKKRKLLNEDE